MSPSTGQPGVGSAADEAARLADALKGWFCGAATGVGASPDHAPTPPHDPLTCRVCPLCRGIAAVRPEVVEHLASAAESLAAALRELGASRTPSPRQPESADRGGPTYETVHIDIDDDDEDEGAG